MTGIILPIVAERLTSLIENEVGLLWGVSKEMEKLASTVSTIQAVLEDAEQKQHLQDHKSVKDWLRKIKYASYEVDDILDDFATHEANPLESGSRKKVRFSDPTSYPLIGNSAFRREIGKRMNDVMERLEQIANERNNYHLRDIRVEKRVGFADGRETGSHITEPQVYGREEEKEKIVKVLINDVADCEHVSVYPIIGMGGLGKTTLAQLVYNDDRVVSHFKKRIWVCVSEDFEVKKILKAIIESLTKRACVDLSLDTLQVRLREMLKRKRYLLVLDDVWNKDQEKWNKLKGVLKGCGSRGASIITTTRLEKVASIMGAALPPHQLKLLCQEDCWLLFKQRAFGSTEREEHPNLVRIGREIVKKCGGVPLAAKALGSLLRFKSEERQWIFVRDSEIWNLPQDDETSILRALRLSYYDLPLELRRCFAYCAVYEKDERIEKDDLIHLWMANGFISSTIQNREIEDIGNEIWNELCLRSFFQDVKIEVKYLLPDKVTFQLHDLLHDLAQSVMDEECRIVEDDRATNNMSSKRVRHLNLIALSKPFTTIPKELHFADSLRTLIYTEKCYSEDTNSSELSIFENYGALRAFATRGSAKNLASSIGGLKHLRYLRLGGCGITTLPDSICNLWNLQTLNLEECFYLTRLPEKMRCLRNLRHLLTSPHYDLFEMPPFIGELTCLETLSRFVVDNKKRKGCGLDELQGLNKLGGSLRITHLERVGNWMDAEKANLIAKENLHTLRLEWDNTDNSEEEYDSQENVEQLLEALQPHPNNLQNLEIYYFKGTHFPLWMMKNYSSYLKSIDSLYLFKCKNCIQLPPLQQLPSLRTLTIVNMDKVEYMVMIDDDDDNNNNNNYQVQDGHRRGNAVRGIFRSLETLTLDGLPNLKGLSNDSNEEEGRGFQSLVLFPRLCKLTIRNCPKLMTNLPLACFPALEELWIKHHPELTSDILSNWLESLTSLRSLEIYNCPKLTSITPNYFRNLTKLQRLTIGGCPELTKRYKKGSGEDWHMIAHIPHVYVSSTSW